MGFLSLHIFFPVLCGLLLLFLPKMDDKKIWHASMVVAGITFICSVVLWTQFDFIIPSVFQWEERFLWIGKYGVYYHVGVDGLSMVMVTLSSFLTFLTFWLSRESVQKRVKEFVFCILFLETSLIGIFCAIDMFQFYLFWEASLVPLFLLVGMFGGEKRIYAAKKFIIYMLLGSLFMLVGFISLYVLHQQGQGYATTSFIDLVNLYIPHDTQVWLLMVFLFSFLITIPTFPFYTWFSSALDEAPIAASILLAGVFIKIGAYGIVRFAIPLFPLAMLQVAPIMIVASVVTIVYGALLAFKQKNVRAVIGYSTLSHMGFVTLGIFSLHDLAITGAMFQVVVHGLFVSALLIMVGYLEQENSTSNIDSFGGLAKTMPQYSLMFFVVLMASIGVPGLCGFVGEFLILMGVYQSGVIPHALLICLVVVLSIVLSATYCLRLYEKVFLGPSAGTSQVRQQFFGLKHKTIVTILIVFMFYLGIRPNGLLSLVKYELPTQTKSFVTFDWMRNQ